MRMILISFFLAFRVNGFTLEITPLREGPLFRGIPFEGELTISPYGGNLEELPPHFKKLDRGSVLYGVKIRDIRVTEEGVKVWGLFSLLKRQRKMNINGQTYQVVTDREIIEIPRPMAVVTLDQAQENPEASTHLWWSLPLGILLCVGLYFSLKKAILVRNQRKERRQLFNELRVAKHRQDFERLYYKRESIHALFREGTPLEPFFKRIEENLYIRHWDEALLEDIFSKRGQV